MYRNDQFFSFCSVVKAAFVTVSLLVAGGVSAASFFEVGVGAHSYDLEISPRNAPIVWVDDSQALNLSIAAYRKSSEKTAWGAAIEISSPQGRDEELPGSGRILSFRPVNFQLLVSQHFTAEFYAGVAQYDWLKKANGYIFGTSLRYQFGENSRMGLALDGKYYMELAYDSGQGDDFVNGFNPGVKFFYRF
ncbi:hypothetical protein TDB9533_02107 [Thalassocella blandensis]|nr:hypothetical protein TDB9533_02107 [Thalassocella blandensis]